jgi:putative pyruvate formate lyase activating enzyme
MLEGKINIYLPDLKYADNSLAKRYSNADNYFEIATEAIKEMYRQVGKYVIDENGIMKKGVIIRHLILPGYLENTKKVIDWVKETFEEGDVIFSLMSQYTPTKHCEDKNLNRSLTREEYDEIEDYLFSSGIDDGFIQELSSACEDYIPPFDLTGL